MRNILLTGLLTLLLAASAMAQLPGGITILPATADGSTGTFGFRELRTNGTNATGFRAPTSLAADVYYTLPSADGSSGECLSTNGSGTLSWASCSGGGSSYYQTVRTFGGVDLTQRSVLRIASPAISVYDDAGGAETEMTLVTSPAIAAVLVGTGRTLTTTTPLTIAGTTSADLSADRTLACPTCVTTNTTQTITGAKTLQQTLTTRTLTPEAGNTYSLGTYTGVGGDGSYQFAHIRNVRSSQLAVGIWDVLGFTGYHRWEPGTLNQSQIKDSSGVSVLGFNSNVTPDMVTVYGSLTVNSVLNVSSASTLSGGLVIPAGTNSTIRTGDAGNLWLRSISGAPTCTGDGDGSSADGDTDGLFYYDYTNNRLYVCDGTEERFIDLGT